MNKQDYDKYFNRLYSIAKRKGYLVGFKPNYGSMVSHLTKTIVLKENTEELDKLYAFSHELGHCYIYKKIKKRKLNELVAWIVGFFLCLTRGVPIRKRFFTLSYECLLTYWKKKKKSK